MQNKKIQINRNEQANHILNDEWIISNSLEKARSSDSGKLSKKALIAYAAEQLREAEQLA
jgi:hypothetical protein